MEDGEAHPFWGPDPANKIGRIGTQARMAKYVFRPKTYLGFRVPLLNLFKRGTNNKHASFGEMIRVKVVRVEAQFTLWSWLLGICSGPQQPCASAFLILQNANAFMV